MLKEYPVWTIITTVLIIGIVVGFGLGWITNEYFAVQGAP